MLNDILAGIIAGLVFSTVLLGDCVFILMTNRAMYDHLSKVLKPPLTPITVMLGTVFSLPLIFAIVGAVGGILYNIISEAQPDGGLGSPNLIFTIIALCIAGVSGVVILLIRRKLIIVPGLLTSIAFAGIFGWILPLIADWR